MSFPSTFILQSSISQSRTALNTPQNTIVPPAVVSYNMSQSSSSSITDCSSSTLNNSYVSNSTLPNHLKRTASRCNKELNLLQLPTSSCATILPGIQPVKLFDISSSVNTSVRDETSTIDQTSIIDQTRQLSIAEVELVSSYGEGPNRKKRRRWVSFDTYWESQSEQRSNLWHEERFCRLTASKLAEACGMSNFGTPMELALDITGIQKKQFDAEALRRMNYGTQYEPQARDWFERTYHFEVDEKGLCVPKWELLMGSSSDGEVKGHSAIVEIKCPDGDVYGPLKDHLKRQQTGWQPPLYYHNHIWTSHYLQMQMNMKVTGRQECHYIVFCPRFDNVYVEKVKWNPDYWTSVVEPKIKVFLDEYLRPLIESHKLGDKIIYPSEDQVIG